MVYASLVCDPPPMPRLRRRPIDDPAQTPLPLTTAKPANQGRETPEQLAKRLGSRRPSPPGIPNRVELTL